ncbi:hypothetical protein V6N11_007677 [Hibiscus sabdariffa]|uniref:VAN3-binding protein-like auxin canalisation domain-containing protein n=1 Tax=Hibiscus sabdariffa TaxID=183260 RepID=A0ABR2NJD8_9ROSI
MQYKKLVATEIPRECIEFLARSWSLSATELLKALANKCMVASVGNEMRGARSTASREPPLQDLHVGWNRSDFAMGE